MKSFIILATVLACAYAKPQFYYNGLGGYPYNHFGAVQYTAAPGHIAYSAPAVTYAAAPAIFPAVTKTQYHAQDELGQASYGYSHPGQAHAAVRDAFGNVRGSYAYIGADGKEVRTNYVADAVHGFHVESNALPVGPVPVSDTPEVAEAKAAHAKAVEEAVVRNAEAEKTEAAEGATPEDQPQPAVVLAGPEPVQDTPEVTQAKIAHFAAVAEAQARSGRKKRALVSPFGYSYGVPSGYGYSTAVTHYAGVPALTYAASPALTYAASPVLTYGAAPVHYSAVSHIAAPAAVTYAASPIVAAQAVREATLTKVVNTPGHAVSYRVD